MSSGSVAGASPAPAGAARLRAATFEPVAGRSTVDEVIVVRSGDRPRAGLLVVVGGLADRVVEGSVVDQDLCVLRSRRDDRCVCAQRDSRLAGGEVPDEQAVAAGGDVEGLAVAPFEDVRTGLALQGVVAGATIEVVGDAAGVAIVGRVAVVATGTQIRVLRRITCR